MTAPQSSSSGIRTPLAWRFEAATLRIWENGVPVGWDGWEWKTTEFEPNMGEAMRNVTPLYVDVAQGSSQPFTEDALLAGAKAIFESELSMADWHNPHWREFKEHCFKCARLALGALPSPPAALPAGEANLPTLDEYRNNLIEECAKIAEPWAGFWLSDSSTEADRAVVAVRTEIAAKIRGLAIPSTNGGPAA